MPQIFFFENARFCTIFGPNEKRDFQHFKSKRQFSWLTKKFYLCQEILTMQKVTLEWKFLLYSKKVYIQKKILFISIRNQLKYIIFDKCVLFVKKCMNFAKTFLQHQNFLGTRFPGSTTFCRSAPTCPWNIPWHLFIFFLTLPLLEDDTSLPS